MTTNKDRAREWLRRRVMSVRAEVGSWDHARDEVAALLDAAEQRGREAERAYVLSMLRAYPMNQHAREWADFVEALPFGSPVHCSHDGIGLPGCPVCDPRFEHRKTEGGT